MKLETISKYKKKIALSILGYFVIGYIVVLGLYLLSNPGLFQTVSTNCSPIQVP